MRADLAVLVLLVKRDPRLPAGSGQTRRIDDCPLMLHLQSLRNSAAL